ncbi:MAG: hypothetical protein U0M02_03030 [Acutalibacteraceae bacterium]|nr:hypothetical protein [Acutalibacteraceae bacterium]
MKYLVTEIQSFPAGATSTPTYAYDSANYGNDNEKAKQAATAKFHSILAGASTSDVPLHGAIMYTDKGVYVRSEYFTHNTEPEETEQGE